MNKYRKIGLGPKDGDARFLGSKDIEKDQKERTKERRKNQRKYGSKRKKKVSGKKTKSNKV